MRILISVTFTLCFSILLIGCNKHTQTETENTLTERTLENRLGTHFEEITPAHFKPPNVSRLDILGSLSGNVIWGATGRDDYGNIYLGASTYKGFHNNAYLYQYDPRTKTFTAQGNVLDQLKKAQLYKEGMSQTTLHSKIYMANDGYLYFASLDKLHSNDPTSNDFSSFFWRKKPSDKDWEHLLSTREALVAVNTGGRFVYALGTPGHVLYQFDTQSNRVKRITVGSVGDHISPNFLVCASGSIFVPRVQTLSNHEVVADLIEYDSGLNMVDSHPIEYYHNLNYGSQHGIISYVNMINGDIYFVTSQGALYQVSENNALKHDVAFISFLDELEEPGNYIASLFSPDGQDYLVGMGTVPEGSSYKWFIHEISNNVTVAYDIPNFSTRFLLFGSITRDNSGDFYIGGVDNKDPNQSRMAFLRLGYNQDEPPLGKSAQ